MEERIPAEDYARLYGFRASAIRSRIKAGILNGVRENGRWYVIQRKGMRLPIQDASETRSHEQSAPREPAGMPLLFRICRALAVGMCLPSALVLIYGVLVPGGPEITAVVSGKDIHLFTVRGREHESHRLFTDQGRVEVSYDIYRLANDGDSLLLQRGPFRVGLMDVDQKVSLIRNNQVVHKEEGSGSLLLGSLALALCATLFSLRPYEKWQHDTRFKIVLVMITAFTLLFWLILLAI